MRTSAAEQDPRLARNLGEHRRADMAFGPGAPDELAELVDPRALLLNPLLDALIDEARVGPGHFKLVEPLASGERGDPEHSVELEEAHQQVDDVVARAKRNQ